ncbi:MAG: pantoate--beta-alanine ligase [Bdellovibrionota bacterium]
MKSPLVIDSIEQLRAWRKTQGLATVGFVPTMGALHQGHASLLVKSRKENKISVLSIYVNPTQFNNSEDLEKYPKTWEQDYNLAAENGVDLIFAPKYSDIYADGYRYRVQENVESKILCGAHRPGHFDGVLTIVMKLLQLVKPTKAYFGEKDFQQLKLIQGMVKSFFMEVEIVPVATTREQDGLAMSSRNLRLNDEQRKTAASIYQNLNKTQSAEEIKYQLNQLGFKVDYVEDHWNRRFIAANLGQIRLIDNIEIEGESLC